MVKNNYIDDAKYFFNYASKKIKKNLEREDLIQIVLNFSFGIERILKGILYNVNPLYILKDSEFSNSFPVLYKTKIINKCKDDNVIRLKPNEDVITYRQSLIRSQIISKVTFENKATLYKLGDFRDIIAHCNLNLLDESNMKMLIYRDYYPLLRSYCDELQISKAYFFENSSIRIANISSNYQEEKEKQIELKLEAAKEYWLSIKDDTDEIELAKKQTNKKLSAGETYEVKCPCCNNSSILYYESVVEYIPQFNQEELIDFIPRLFVCKYCKLKLEDYSLIDFLIMPIVSGIKNSNETIIE